MVYWPAFHRGSDLMSKHETQFTALAIPEISPQQFFACYDNAMHTILRKLTSFDVVNHCSPVMYAIPGEEVVLSDTLPQYTQRPEKANSVHSPWQQPFAEYLRAALF